jgi:hypothetical protein
MSEFPPAPLVIGEAWRPGGVDAALFRAVCDPHRRRVLEAVVGGPATLTELSRRLGSSRQMVAYHAGVLVKVGLLEMRGHWATARPAALRSLSGYFDQALVGAARAAAQISAQKSGRGATKSSKYFPQ